MASVLTKSTKKKTLTNKRLDLVKRKNELIFIVGGARSGKSDLALKFCRTLTPRAFVATAEPLDREMASRIQKHQRRRRGQWTTVEIPVEISHWFRTKGRNYQGVIVDCLTLWLNNILAKKTLHRKFPSLLKDWLQAVRNVPGRVIVISNEVGFGIVPGDPLTRHFRDLAGQMNQRVASAADEVYFVVSGIPLRLK